MDPVQRRRRMLHGPASMIEGGFEGAAVRRQAQEADLSSAIGPF